MDMDSLLECEVCFEHYDEAERRPRSLPCGHSLCHACLVDNIATNAGYITCPFCRLSCSDTPVIAEDFPTNYTLLRISEKSLREASTASTSSDHLQKFNNNLKRENKSTLKHIQSCNENLLFLKNYKTKLKSYKLSSEQTIEELKWAFDQMTISIEHMNTELNQIEDIQVKGENLRQELFNVQENLADVTSMQCLESVCHGARKSYTATKRWSTSVRKNLMDSDVIPVCEKVSVSVQQRLRNLTSVYPCNVETHDPLLTNTEETGFVTSSPRPSRVSRNSIIITGIRESILNDAQDMVPIYTRENLTPVEASDNVLDNENVENIELNNTRNITPIDSINAMLPREHRDSTIPLDTRISDTNTSVTESREDDETGNNEFISNESTNQPLSICEEENRERINQIPILENNELDHYRNSSMLMNMSDSISGHINDNSNTQEQDDIHSILNASISSSIEDQPEIQNLPESLEPIDSVSGFNISDNIDQMGSIPDTAISVSPVPRLVSSNIELSVNRERLVSILDEDDFDEEDDIVTEPEPLMWWKIESSDVSGAKPWWKDGPISHSGSSLPTVPHLVPRWLEENRPTSRRSSEEGVNSSESEVRTLSPEVLQVLAGSNGLNALWDIVVNASTRDMPVFAVRQASGGSRQSASLTCYDGRLHLHALKEQDPPAHAITVPYEIVEKMSGKFLVTTFLEISWAREMRGILYIQVRGDSRRGKCFLLLCCGKRGSSYTNMHFLRLYNHYRPGECVTTGDIENYDKYPVVLPKRTRFGTFRTGIKGGLVAGWASGEDLANPSKFCIYLRDQPGAEDAEAFGMVESGLDVLHQATSLSSISEAFVSSCGLVLSPDYT